MRVSFIIDSLRRDGAQRFLTHLVRGLSALGYEQTVISLNNVVAPRIETALTEAGCKVIRIGKASLLLAGAGWWRLVATLKRSAPRIVVTLLDFADTLGRPAARLAGCSVLVSSIRVRNLAKPSWQRWIDRKTIGWANKVIVNTNEIVAYVCENEGVQRAQLVVIPNGVENLQERSAGLREEYRSKAMAGSDTVVLGWVGRLNAQKNPLLFLDVCAKLSTKSPWEAIVVGDGPERNHFLKRVNELGLREQVTWLGEREDVEGWLAAMDILVHTADFEGMPNAIMEAMSMGLPVVASGVDGARELIEDGVNGFLVPPREADAFAKRIVELIEDLELRKRLGRRAHRDVLAQFKMDGMIQAYDALFKSLGEGRTA